MTRQRLDQLLVERGLYPSREKARRAVMAGLVLIEGRRVDKAGTQVDSEARIELEQTEPFVSRAGRKLAQALDFFELAPRDFVCMDVGASTGGFTDCLLERGARRVYAVDVGYGQMDSKVANDDRVVVMDRINARHLEPDALPEPCDLVTIDVSFISVLKIIPAVVPHMKDGALLLPMIKPQFEVGREGVGKGGIVRDEDLRRRVIAQRIREISELEVDGTRLEPIGSVDNEVAGVGGNREGFALFQVHRQRAIENEDGS